MKAADDGTRMKMTRLDGRRDHLGERHICCLRIPEDIGPRDRQVIWRSYVWRST